MERVYDRKRACDFADWRKIFIFGLLQCIEVGIQFTPDTGVVYRVLEGFFFVCNRNWLS